MSAALERRLERMESNLRRVLRCLWCRVNLTDVTTEQKQKYEASPVGALNTKCWYCGNPYLLRLGRSSARHKEAANLVYNSHPVKVLSDERLHAASLYLQLSYSHRKRYELLRSPDALQKLNAMRSKRQTPVPLDAKGRKARQEREALEARARAFVEKKQAEFKRRAGRGDEPFPIDKRLAELDAQKLHEYSDEIKAAVRAAGFDDSRQGFYDLTREITRVRDNIISLRKREACEVVIWGKASAETLSELAFFKAQESVVIAEAQEKRRKDEEERAQKAAEEKRKHEEYLARTRNQQSANAQPVAPQAANPNHDNFLKEVMGETAYSAMREAQAVGKDNPATDAHGRRRTELPYIPPEPESKPPPDDGTLRYQQKLAHWRRTGVWLPDEWMQ